MKIQNLSQLKSLFTKAKGRRVRVTFVYEFGEESRSFKHFSSAVAYLYLSTSSDLISGKFSNLYAEIV